MSDVLRDLVSKATHGEVDEYFIWDAYYRNEEAHRLASLAPELALLVADFADVAKDWQAHDAKFRALLVRVDRLTEAVAEAHDAEVRDLAARAEAAEKERDELRQEMEHPFDKPEFDRIFARAEAAEKALREVKQWVYEYGDCDCDEEGTCLYHRIEDIGGDALAGTPGQENT